MSKVPLLSMSDAMSWVKDTQDVGNNLEVIEYKNSEYGNRDGIDRQFLLTGSDPTAFKKIFGDPEFYYHGEYCMTVWFHKFESVDFVIFSGKGYGNSYEVRYNGSFSDFRRDHETGQVIVRFLKNLAEKLQEMKT